MDQTFWPQSRGFISGDILYATTDEDPWIVVKTFGPLTKSNCPYTAYYYDTWKGYRHPLPNYLSAQLAWKPSRKLPHSAIVNGLHLALHCEQITWRSRDTAMFRTKWPPCAPGNVGATLLYAVRWSFALSGKDYWPNSVDFCVECFIMTSFGCPVMRTSCAVMCVSTETQKKVTNHRGQSQNKQSGFKLRCPTCALKKLLTQ